MKKHYVVIWDWSSKGESEHTIQGVFDDEIEARELFDRLVSREADFAKRNEYTINTYNDRLFDAGLEGWYDTDHTCIQIQVTYN